MSIAESAFEVKRIESESISTTNNGATTALNQVIPLMTPEVSVVNGKTQVVLRFAGPGNTALRSLEDGKYRLKIYADRILGALTSLSLDGDNNGSAGGDYVYKENDVKTKAANPAAAQVDYFFRLFGDQDGDRDVDNTDYLAFSKSLNKTSSQTGYLWFFDIDGASGINSTDLAEFNRRRNKISIKGPAT